MCIIRLSRGMEGCVSMRMCVRKTTSELICVRFGLRASPLDLEIR